MAVEDVVAEREGNAVGADKFASNNESLSEAFGSRLRNNITASSSSLKWSTVRRFARSIQGRHSAGTPARSNTLPIINAAS